VSAVSSVVVASTAIALTVSQDTPSSRPIAAIEVRSTNQPPHHMSSTPMGRRRTGTSESIGGVSEYLSLTRGVLTPVAGHPQLQGMAGRRQVGHRAHDRVPVSDEASAPRAPVGSVDQKIAEHHGDVVEGGVGDGDTEFDGAHDRVGNDRGGQASRLGHRARGVDDDSV